MELLGRGVGLLFACGAVVPVLFVSGAAAVLAGFVDFLPAAFVVACNEGIHWLLTVAIYLFQFQHLCFTEAIKKLEHSEVQFKHSRSQCRQLCLQWSNFLLQFIFYRI